MTQQFTKPLFVVADVDSVPEVSKRTDIAQCLSNLQPEWRPHSLTARYYMSSVDEPFGKAFDWRAIDFL
eukprot:6809688-Pyramimonas_sp.AAC.1